MITCANSARNSNTGIGSNRSMRVVRGKADDYYNLFKGKEAARMLKAIHNVSTRQYSLPLAGTQKYPLYSTLRNPTVVC